MVLALLRDLTAKSQIEATVYLIELGAGHGRLCYHFIKNFETYHQPAIAPPFCYVLSDFTKANLDFMKNHTRLQPYLEKGWIDFALFDATTDTHIQLTHSSRTIKTNTLEQPLVVIANYFFDSIPQELFRIQNGKIEQTLLSISLNQLKKRLIPIHLFIH
ncbi:MAG: SAM-dependent methyltransferase [Bacteroidota bacterium]